MKKIICLILIGIINVNCGAQIIKDISQDDGMKKTNTYFKDMNNSLDPFVGTYVLSSGNKYFKIVLQKMIHSNTSPTNYDDLVVGEYKYVDANGVEKVNTLSQININSINGYKHNICGNNILQNADEPVCNNCNTGEKRLRLGFLDNYPGYIIIRKIVVNGQDAISVFKSEHGENGDENGNYTPAKVPKGTYTLIKQP